ncbi:MAG: hypothetical protein QXE63_00275 [Zestosphaera sp.]
MRGAVKIAKIVFLNQLASLWRQYRPGKLYKKPGIIGAAIIYGVVLLNMLFVVYRYAGSVTNPLDPSLPEWWLPGAVLDVVSALILVLTFTQYYVRESLVVVPPDFEFVLYQPLHVREIYAGIGLGIAAFVLVSLVPMAVLISFIIPWFFFMLIYLFTYVMLVLDPIFFISSRVLRRLGRLSIVSVVVQAYIVFGVLHSLFNSFLFGGLFVSPFLSYPITWLYFIVLSLYELVGYASFLAYFLIVFCFFLLVVFFAGGWLDVSDFTSFRDVYEVRLLRDLKKVLRRDVLVSWSSPSDALRRVVLEFTVYSPRLMFRKYLPLFLGSLAAAFLVRGFLPQEYLVELVEQYLIPIVVALGVGAYVGFIRELLANDLKYLWVYRVYLIDLSFFSRVLMLKYVIASLVVVSVVSVLAASLSADFAVFLGVLVVAPACVFSVFIVLLTAVLLLRRAKSQEPASEVYLRGGLPVLDPVSQLLFLPLVISGIITYSSLALYLFLVFHGLIPYIYVAAASATSPVVSYVAYSLFSSLLARVLAEVDVRV